MRKAAFLTFLIVAAVWSASAWAAEPFFLKRNLAEIQPKPDDLTAGARGVSYKPVFGVGDPDAGRLQGVVRYGELTVLPGGVSAVVSYPDEEQIYYVLEGNGVLIYGDQRAPIKKDDFMYLPVNVRHGVANESGAPLRVIVMGYRIPAGRQAPAPPQLMIANAEDVPLQILGGHGPTSQFKLLMGQTTSQRDKLAAASEMTSLFIMDFAPGGTNIPHSHATEEEIYLVLRGSGEIVAGQTPSGEDARHPAKQGDVFFFGPGTRVGYYSHAKEGQPHDLILAVRSRLPSAGMGRRGGVPPKQ
ncbi:MAG: cupin domain-containing protein [Bryobacteraceae bacterium]|nr:cupin domain-containing protein [Bryobacteraceae bacterium]